MIGQVLGYQRTESLPDHVKAIWEFPTPKNLTDMRSYFALVNQVAPYYAVQPHLQPFRELLKKGSRWYWDNRLQELFQESRIVIAKEILDGITRFEVGRWKGLMTEILPMSTDHTTVLYWGLESLHGGI